jgi:hypothetical protein
VPVIGKVGSLAQGATPIVAAWDYNALAAKDTLAGNPPVEVIVPKTGVVAGVYVQAISAYAPHPNAAKLWMEYLYSDEGQLGWLKGYCHPIRFNDMVKAGKIPQELLDKLPPAEAYAKAACSRRSTSRTPTRPSSPPGLGLRRRRQRPVSMATLSAPAAHSTGAHFLSINNDPTGHTCHSQPAASAAHASRCRALARRAALRSVRPAVPDPADAEHRHRRVPRRGRASFTLRTSINLNDRSIPAPSGSRSISVASALLGCRDRLRHVRRR